MTANVAGKSPYSVDLKIHSALVARDFAPDGNLQKSPWRKAEWVGLVDWSGRAAPTEFETRAATLWSTSRVYFAFSCKYSVLNVYENEDPAVERWKLWERDVVEVFLNPEPARVNHYYEFEVAPTNQWIDLEIDLDKKPFNDANWNSGFAHAARIHPEQHSWTCEMSLPLASMGAQRPCAGAEWRLNFYRAAGLGDNQQRYHLCWSPVLGDKPNFHMPTRFGIIRFV